MEVRPPFSAAEVAAALDLAVVMGSPFLGARLEGEVDAETLGRKSTFFNDPR